MGKLVIIPTPIGNLGDITLRALEMLRSVDILFAEDTRVTRKLLLHFEISRDVISYHQHNEHRQLDRFVDMIAGAGSAGLVSDAGTPGISDPGFLLIRECIARGIDIDCLPGPAALLPALVQSGFPTDRFVFEGFLPHKKGRLKRLEALKEEPRTIVFYESPYRLLKLLEQIGEVLGEDRPVSVSREITKLFEETARGTADEVHRYFKEKGIKGEFVVVVQGRES